MAQLLQSLFVDPEELARASEKAHAIEACACEHGLDPRGAGAFLSALVGRGDVVVCHKRKHAALPAPNPNPKHRRVVCESESEAEAEPQAEAGLDVEVLQGTLDEQEAFLLPTEWHEDGVSVKKGTWFYALSDLQDDDALVLKGSQRIFYDFLFQGDGHVPVLMRSNHTQTFQGREIMCRTRRGTNARGRVWTRIAARDLAFYDCDKKMVVSHAVGAPEYVRARQRIRARDFLEKLIQRGLGHRTAEWRAYLENPQSKLEQVRFVPIGPLVKGVCGACGQNKRLSVAMRVAPEDKALLSDDMFNLGSFCARHLEHAPQLAAFSVHNRSEGMDTQSLLCAAHEAMCVEEEVE